VDKQIFLALSNRDHKPDLLGIASRQIKILAQRSVRATSRMDDMEAKINDLETRVSNLEAAQMQARRRIILPGK
jgi:polyhydroxyalkanoate synthesis regulator phasin